jgi:hypothetical protein
MISADFVGRWSWHLGAIVELDPSYGRSGNLGTETLVKLSDPALIDASPLWRTLMPRYFFDVHDDDQISRDVTGFEFDDLAAACLQAKQLLPAIALDEVPKDGDRKIYAVVMSDEARIPIYSATLTFAGMMLRR